jgi:hypothetical protein
MQKFGFKYNVKLVFSLLLWGSPFIATIAWIIHEILYEFNWPFTIVVVLMWVVEILYITISDKK